jgi:Zn-dependent M28 family amino/carboxypeptidase
VGGGQSMKGVMAVAAASLATAALAAVAPAVFTPEETAAAERIKPEGIRAHTRALADDLLEGRGTASRGERLAQLYIVGQMESLGLQPGAPDGTWRQPFDVIGMTSQNPDTIRFSRSGGKTLDLRFRDDFIAFSGVAEPEARVAGAEVVFVGYGIVAPEYGWDDYKGADVTGKVVLMMNNDPEDDPKLFAGKTRLYYGRWDYKYENAARHGAAGAIIIHTTPSAGYPWQVVQSSWTTEQFSLPDEGGPVLRVMAWTTEDASRRIAALGGQDLDSLRAAAQQREFKAVPLGVTVDAALRNEVRRKTTANVLGRLPGSDPALSREAVVYTAHYDHLGMKENPKPGEDAIYNGARDNASGVAAMLEVARAMAALPKPPRRSVIFVATAAEEQGLLGSRYLVAHPPLPAGRMAVDINIDEMNLWGRTRDLIMIGLGKSSVDDWVHAIAAMQGRHVEPDASPDKGFFYRSDQFPFAKAGVPAAYFEAGTDVVDQPAGYGEQKRKEYDDRDYHQPSDEIRPDWDLSGAVEDARFFFYLGIKAANADAMPAWRPGDEFEAARKKSLTEASR